MLRSNTSSCTRVACNRCSRLSGRCGQKRRTAIGSWAAMVGAMILARASDDPALSDEVLDQTRVWLEAKTKDRRQHNSRNRSTKDCGLTKG